MPDYVPIQDLTIVGSVDDNDLFPMSDGYGAYAVRGSTIKSYAAGDAAAAATAAQSAANAAAQSKAAAEAAQSAVEGAAADAAASEEAAEAAQAAAEAAQAAAEEALITDKTLTQKGKPADAYSAGSGLDAAFTPITFSPTLYNGAYFKVSDGAAASSAKYARTLYLIDGATRSGVTLNSSAYEFCLTFYDSTGTVSGTGYLGNSGYQLGGTIYVPKTAAKFGISFRRLDQANMSSSDITALSAALSAADIDAVKYMSAQPLTSDQAAQARKNIDSVGNDTLYQYNFYDAFRLGNGATTEKNGVTYTKNADGTWSISGTASAFSFCNIIRSEDAIPRYIIPGRKYKCSFNGGGVEIQIFIYKDGDYISNQVFSSDFEFTFPSDEDMDGLIIRFKVDSGVQVSETVNYEFIPYMSTGNEINNYYTYEETVNKTVQEITNTYDLDVSPSITTDNHSWLAAVDTNTSDETGKTDMTAAIMAMLNSTGYCHLGEGIFYVSGNIDIPQYGMLTGCGRKTIIRLLSSVTSGYTVKLQKYATISNLRISGQYSATTKTTQGTRSGIVFIANDDGNEGGSAYDTEACMISNVWIDGFTDSGIKCHNTSTSVSKGLYASNVYLSYCWAGINIDYRSEFHKFTNVLTASCYYGCINNGGNNVFTACTFGATSVGFFIDGTKYNTGHGTLNGCTFCHVGSNEGSAITMTGVANGFVVSNCQVWYCSIDLTSCSGISFVGCEFGRGTTGEGATINISGGNLILFSGCTFMNDVNYPPDITVSNNTKTRFVGCYGAASGKAIAA